MTDQELILATAAAECGVVEVGGQNRGARVEQYLAAVHAPAGSPWCAAFVAWVGRSTLEPWPLPLVAGCMSLYDGARSRGLLGAGPAPAAVFLKWFPALKRFAHTGFVVRPMGDGAWVTIEGNSNPDGGREGYGVFQRVRRFAPDDRFIHWWAPARPSGGAA